MALDRVLQKVYDEKIHLDVEMTKKCKAVVENFVESCFIIHMRKVDSLFDALYQNLYFGGSFYDGLRVGTATEFDLNVILNFPFSSSEISFTKDQPGFFTISVSNMIHPRHPRYDVYRKISQLCEVDSSGYRLIPAKTRSWFEGVCQRAKNQLSSAESQGLGISYVLLRKQGPALTLNINLRDGTNIDVDLAPVIQHGYQGNTDVMYCVPKPHPHNAHIWRCSFPNEEREILHNAGCAKTVVKLLKKMRDTQGWSSLASYYLKTVVMLMPIHDFPANRLGYGFISALESLESRLTDRNIPFYHDHGYNLIGNIYSSTIDNIRGQLRSIIRDFKVNRENDPRRLARYF